MSLHAGEGAAWGLPLKGKCKAVELAAYWPCLRAYLESRANETARVVVVSTAGRADLPGGESAPVADVIYLADRPPPPCVSCVLFVFATSAAMACCFVRGPDDSATTRDMLPHRAPSTRSNPSTLCTQAGDAAVERARRRARARPGRHGVGDGPLLLAGLERGRARRGARARRHRLRRGVQPRAGLRLGAAPAPDQDPGGPRGCKMWFVVVLFYHTRFFPGSTDLRSASTPPARLRCFR